MDDNYTEDDQALETSSKNLKEDCHASSSRFTLPDGWVRLRHTSGLPIYLHRVTRVVTVSRPYSVLSGSVRYHKIPMDAIPCLAFRSANQATSTIVKPESIVPNLESSKEQVRSQTFCDSTPGWVDTHNQISSNELPKSRTRKCAVDREEGELSSAGEDEYEVPVSSEPEPKKSCLSSVDRTAAVDVTVVSVRSGSVFGKRKRRRRQMTFINSHSTSACAPTDSTEQSSETIQLDLGQQGTSDETFAVQQDTSKFEHIPHTDNTSNGVLLTHEEVRAYCSRMLAARKFDAPSHRLSTSSASMQPGSRSRTPAGKDNETQDESNQTAGDLLGLPGESKVIRYQFSPVEGDPVRQLRKEGLINLTGKSHVCILHEYCQNVLRRPPTYQTVVLDNEPQPYQLTVLIDGKPYATGVGQSKKQARLEAARRALSRLIPDFDKLVDPETNSAAPANTTSSATDRDLQLFDDIKLSDPRLYELSIRMGLPTPYNLLVECLSRSCIPETELKSSMNSHGRSRHFFTLQLREHIVKIPCKNKREGRHLAAQLMFGRIHPELTSWGEVLRIYGPGSKPDKKGELETIQGAQNQEKSAVKTSLIRLLKSKMRELAEQWEKGGGLLQPKGKFFVSPDNLPVVSFHPDSRTDLYSSIPVSSASSSSSCANVITSPTPSD